MIEGKLLGRTEITGIIKLRTGMHIGKSKDTLQIGGIDNPIVRDPFSGQPYIPGSSFKGKMRCLAEKVLVTAGNSDYHFDYQSGVGGDTTIFRHECPTVNLAKNCPVCRLFGSTGNNDTLKNYQDRKEIPENERVKITTNFPARVTVLDAFLTEGDEGSAKKYEGLSELPYAEWKSENTVDRITAAANPRQVERAAKGWEFKFHLTYAIKPDRKVIEDLQNLLFAMYLVEENGLGGQTSRGYGRIDFSKFNLSVSHYSVTPHDGELATFTCEEKTTLGLSNLSLTELRNKVDSEEYQGSFIDAYPEALE